MANRIVLNAIIFAFGFALGIGVAHKIPTDSPPVTEEMMPGNSGSDNGTGVEDPPKEVVLTDTRYVHSDVNVRAKPTTSSDVNFTLDRGESVEVVSDSAENGWVPVRRNQRRVGYVAERLLEGSSLPDVEIADWNWRTDAGFGTDGAVIWVVELRNNTERYIESVEVRFSTYDSSGGIITSTIAFVENIPPGGTGSEESYADYYGREERGRIQVVDTRYGGY